MKKITWLLLCLSCCLLTACTLFDDDAPELLLTQDGILTLEANSEFNIDDYYNVSDNRSDRDDIAVISSIDTSKLGIQEVLIKAIDEAENETTINVEITVQDTTAPDISLNGESNVTLNYNTDYEELGASISDNFDKECKITISGNVNTSELGSYKLIYSSTDSSGNESSVERTIEVIDTKAPVFEAENVPSEITLGETLTTICATDNVDGNIPISVTGEINYCKAGDYNVELYAEDSSGNSISESRTITILPITINLPNEVTIEMKEFSTEVDDYYWMQSPVLVILADIHNNSEETVELSPHFWWVNEEYGNDSLYNSFGGYTFSVTEIAANSVASEEYAFRFSREPENFYNCNEMRFDNSTNIYLCDNLTYRFTFTLQELFDASTID